MSLQRHLEDQSPLVRPLKAPLFPLVMIASHRILRGQGMPSGRRETVQDGRVRSYQSPLLGQQQPHLEDVQRVLGLEVD